MRTATQSPVICLVREQVRAVGDGYRPDLDGLRALAALAVVAVHTVENVFPGGRSGVDMFFVLSGFLISGIILRALMQEKFSFSNFYSRRIRRIFPALLLVLLVVWAVSTVVLLPDDYERLGKGIATSAAFCLYIFLQLESSFWDLYVTDHGGWMLAQLWSLGVEEQFYLLWPLIIVAAWKLLEGNLSRVTLITALITAMSLFLFLARNSLPPYVTIVPWRAVFELSLGGLLACTQLKAPESLVRLRLTLKARGYNFMNPGVSGAIAGILLTASILIDVRHFSTLGVLMPAIGTALFISAGMTSWLNRVVFAAAPMVFIGLISYPIYLWHFPLVLFLDLFRFDDPLNRWILFVVVLWVSVVLSFLTYKYVELPIRFHPKQVRVVILLVSTMACTGLLGLAVFGGLIRPISFYYGADPAYAASEDWLQNSPEVTWTKQQGDAIVLGSGTPRVLFIGDSNMQQYLSRVEQLYMDEQLTRGAIFMTRFGCVPGIDKINVTKIWDREACKRHLEEVMTIAGSSEIETVVIGACWYVYFAELSDPRNLGRPAPFRAGSDAAFNELSTFIHNLSSQGKVVYLVLNIPIGREFDPRSFTAVAGQFKATDQGIGRHGDAQIIRAALNPIHNRLRQIAKDAGALVIDPLESLCDEKSCPAVSISGGLMYHDLWHLRPSYVRHEAHFLDAVLLREGARKSRSTDARSLHQSTVDEGRDLRP